MPFMGGMLPIKGINLAPRPFEGRGRGWGEISEKLTDTLFDLWVEIFSKFERHGKINVREAIAFSRGHSTVVVR